MAYTQKTTRVDPNKVITDMVIEAIESGEDAPWRKPWAATTTGINAMWPHNPVTKNVYRGINPMILSMIAYKNGYSDTRWVTFKGAQTLNGTVRKGEKGTMVVFWKPLIVEDKDRKDENGKPTKKKIMMLKTYTVFNVEQCDNLDMKPWAEYIAPDPDAEPYDVLAAADEIIENYQHNLNGPTISHVGGDGAFYTPSLDTISLPQRSDFKSQEGYYATVFHECAHSTGHKSRLNRSMEAINHFGDEAYSKEELVAEFTAAFLCGHTGIVQETIENHTAYLKSWIKALKNDSKLLVSAAGKAQAAYDYILGTKHEYSED